MKTVRFTLLFFLFQTLFSIQMYAQVCNCIGQNWPPTPIAPLPWACSDLAGLNLLPAINPNVNFVFDNFGKITGGITLSGSTILRLNVPALAGPNTCRWSLLMYIDNDADAGAGATEWASDLEYTTAGVKPQLDLLQVRVSNGCRTPCIDTWQTFPIAPGDKSCIPIVRDVFANIPAASCVDNVNGAGSYLANFNEFTIVVDYKIVPLPVPPALPLKVRPGQWQVRIHFRLIAEN